MLVIHNGTVLTMDENCPPFTNGAIAIDGESIIATGPCETILMQYSGAELLDAHGGIIMPGLVNMRMQSRALMRPAGTRGSTQLAFDKRLNLDTVKYGAYAAALQCIRNGVTTVFDSAFVPNDPAGTLQTMYAAYGETGVRCCLSFETSELPGSARMSAASDENVDFIRYCGYYKNPSVAASFGIGPVSEQSDFALHLIRAAAPADSGFTVRLNAKTGNDPVNKESAVERLAEFGLLNDKTIICACGETTPDDVELIRSNGASIALASAADVSVGVPCLSTEELCNKSVNVFIGTGTASSDMLEAVRNEEFYSSVRGHCSTGAGVKALLKENPSFAGRLFNCRMGSLAPGASADVIVLDAGAQCCNDADSIIDMLTRFASGRACIHTVSRGRILMKDRKILSVDETRLSKEIAAARRGISR